MSISLIVRFAAHLTSAVRVRGTSHPAGLAHMAILVAAGAATLPAGAATFVVDRTDDDAAAMACTAAPTDCSLRGAVRAANANPGLFDFIDIPAGHYQLTLEGANEEAAMTGDLDLAGTVIIRSIAGGHPVIEQTVQDRIFHAHFATGNVLMMGPMTLLGGHAVEAGGLEVGGSIYAFRNGNLALFGVNVVGGTAPDDGGCIYFASHTDPGYSLVLSDVVITGCAAGSNGGGVFAQVNATDVSWTRAVLEGNAAGGSGGGASLFGPGTVVIQESTIRANTASGVNSLGGGIALAGAAVSILRSTIAENEVGQPGGAVASGGGLNLESGSLILQNSTVSGNRIVGSSFQRGTAVTLEGTSVSLDFSTIVGDPDAGIEAIRTGAGTSVTATASIVFGHCFPAAAIASSGYNLEKPGIGGASTSCGFDEPSDVFTTAAILKPLAGNGGPTPTHALNEGALGVLPAVPAAWCDDPEGGALDQRNAPRANATCSPGSYELGATAPGPEIFSDGFESGSHGAWSSATGS